MSSFHGVDRIEHPSFTTSEGHQSYLCGHCGHQVNGIIIAKYRPGACSETWLLCTHCGQGSVFSHAQQYPGPLFGPQLQGLPTEVEFAYTELRNCMSVKAFTATELVCRKILMHVAVEKGAKEGESFESYIAFLEKQGYITPPMKSWVDLIRQHGNMSTHRLEAPAETRAESTAMFTAELLRLVYEMKHIADRYIPKKT